MSRFGFAYCQNCGRLNIHGARCVCVPTEPIDCDCEGGNHQRIGPKCARRIANVWHDAIARSHAIAEHIRTNQGDNT